MPALLTCTPDAECPLKITALVFPDLVSAHRWQPTEEVNNAQSAKVWSENGGAGGDIDVTAAAPTDNADAPNVEFDEDGNLVVATHEKCEVPRCMDSTCGVKVTKETVPPCGRWRCRGAAAPIFCCVAAAVPGSASPLPPLLY
jgi:hypothetical protein